MCFTIRKRKEEEVKEQVQTQEEIKKKVSRKKTSRKKKKKTTRKKTSRKKKKKTTRKKTPSKKEVAKLVREMKKYGMSKTKQKHAKKILMKGI